MSDEKRQTRLLPFRLRRAGARRAGARRAGVAGFVAGFAAGFTAGFAGAVEAAGFAVFAGAAAFAPTG